MWVWGYPPLTEKGSLRKKDLTGCGVSPQTEEGGCGSSLPLVVEAVCPQISHYPSGGHKVKNSNDFMTYAMSGEEKVEVSYHYEYKPIKIMCFPSQKVGEHTTLICHVLGKV
jgi:hypothetical protein